MAPLLILAAAAAAAAARPVFPASPGPVLVAADLRPGTDLSGQWHYSIDPYRSGLAGFHGGSPNDTERRWAEVDVRAAMRADPRKLFEFDMDAAPTATLPASWIAHAPEMRHYQGLVWYQRHFPFQRTPGRRFFLRFGAANYRARVYLDGQLVGEHEGGFTPFAFEVTTLLRDGDNQVTVGVDSVATDASVPPPVTDWENYGGLTRDIRIVDTPATYVDEAWVRLAPDGRIAVDAHVDGVAAAGLPLTLAIPALRLSLTGRADASGTWHGSAPAPRGLVRWSPDRPQLYDVSLSAGEDRWHDRIGFRTIAVRGHDILLNGKPIFLRGISMHEEELGTDPARAVSAATQRSLLEEIKLGLHGNFVRLAHYPHSEATTRLADELGLLVWSEVPVYWRIDWGNPQTLATARVMVAENIRRDRNRAAIVIWSIANETPVSDARNLFLRTLAADVRALDNSRLVSAALLVDRAPGGDHPVMAINDPLAADLDVLSVNTYNGWYTDDALDSLPRSEWHVPADKPLVFSEFGADAKAGFHDLRPTPQKVSEEYQAAYFRQTLAMAATIPTLAGMSPWLLKDFRSPRRQNGWEQGWNRKGLISETGRHKQAFDVLAGWYADKAAR